MGRQVGMVGSGLTNTERGISLLEHKYFLDQSYIPDYWGSKGCEYFFVETNSQKLIRRLKYK